MILQEEFQHDPWQMLVACIMLNQTSNVQVRRVIYTFFERWPTPQALLEADSNEIREHIRSLGFYNRRTETLLKFSRAWIEGGWSANLPGIGRYARDSWSIFQEGLTDVEVTDKILQKWLNGELIDQ